MYSGKDRMKSLFDNYNFYAAQCRIRIEMSFGIYTQKWAIFQTELKNRMRMVKLLALGGARLHNYCIDERKGWNPLAESRRSYQVTDPTEMDIDAGCELPASRRAVGISNNRHRMALEIQRKGLVRPLDY
jgi:hypothetical protein